MKKAVEKQKPWSRMTRNQRKVAVAQDVLLALKSKTYDARSMYKFAWGKNVDEGRILATSHSILKKQLSKPAFQEYLKEPGLECAVCQRGALLLSCVRLRDDLTFAKYRNTPIEKMEKMYDVFDRHELRVMEVMFESGYSPYAQRKDFGIKNGLSAKSRMAAICRAIIRVNGNLKSIIKKEEPI